MFKLCVSALEEMGFENSIGYISSRPKEKEGIPSKENHMTKDTNYMRV